MGADEEWSPLESHSGGDPTMSPLIADPPTLYRNAVLRSPRSTTGVRIPDRPTGISRLVGPDRLAKLAGPGHPGLRMGRTLVAYQTWTGEVLDREE